MASFVTILLSNYQSDMKRTCCSSSRDSDWTVFSRKVDLPDVLQWFLFGESTYYLFDLRTYFYQFDRLQYGFKSLQYFCQLVLLLRLSSYLEFLIVELQFAHESCSYLMEIVFCGWPTLPDRLITLPVFWNRSICFYFQFKCSHLQHSRTIFDLKNLL